MSTVLANPAEMIRMGAPHVIRSEEELVEYTDSLFELTAKTEPTPEEETAIELLALLIESYELEHYPVPQAPPSGVLRFLVEHNGLSQRDLVTEIGSEAAVSLALSGKRPLTTRHIKRLSDRFHVSPSVFFGEEAQLPAKPKRMLGETVLGKERLLVKTNRKS